MIFVIQRQSFMEEKISTGIYFWVWQQFVPNAVVENRFTFYTVGCQRLIRERSFQALICSFRPVFFFFPGLTQALDHNKKPRADLSQLFQVGTNELVLPAGVKYLLKEMTCDFMRKSYTRAASTGRVMTMFGGMAPRLQLSHSDRAARRPSGHRSSKSDDLKPSTHPVEFKPEWKHKMTTDSTCVWNSATVSWLCILTEDVGMEVVLLQEGHVTVAFPTRISNKTPEYWKWEG